MFTDIGARQYNLQYPLDSLESRYLEDIRGVLSNFGDDHSDAGLEKAFDGRTNPHLAKIAAWFRDSGLSLGPEFLLTGLEHAKLQQAAGFELTDTQINWLGEIPKIDRTLLS